MRKMGSVPIFQVLLDHEEGVGAPVGLDRQGVVGVDRGAILDAALLRLDGGNVGAERLQDGVALAGLCGDDCDDVDHCLSYSVNFSLRPNSLLHCKH